MEMVVDLASIKIFFLFNAIVLFTSLAVVVVQIILVSCETKAERRMVEMINKLMRLTSVCTSVAFMASSSIVVGVLGTMTYYVFKSKKTRLKRKKEKIAKRVQNHGIATLSFPTQKLTESLRYELWKSRKKFRPCRFS
ncbi:putative PGG domain-containing protein [Helianthus anomalus]